jgi:tRNA threonylcarbamoyladenosine biosynthesis protein TsaE
MKTRTLETADSPASEALGARIAAYLPALRLLYARGPLGAGKTTLVRGLLRGLGHTGTVKSPTFTLIEPYAFPWGMLYHFDLYRLQDPQELELVGLRDYFGGDSVCVVEWPERAGGLLPLPDLDVIMRPDNHRGRSVQLQAYSHSGEAAVSGL